jgi:hypothetical protein
MIPSVPHSSMTSFSVALEPAPAPRLAAAALSLHLVVAASPWIARVHAPFAALLTLAALAGLAATLGALPGRHHRLAALALDSRGCRVRARGSPDWIPAELGPRSRAYPAAVLLDLRAAGSRHAWLLTRASVPADPFRRLRAHIRLSC